MPSSISKSKFEASRSASTSPSPGFGLSLQTKVVTEICSELGYEVVDGVGGTYKVFERRDMSGVIRRRYSIRVGEGGRKGCPLTAVSFF